MRSRRYGPPLIILAIATLLALLAAPPAGAHSGRAAQPGGQARAAGGHATEAAAPAGLLAPVWSCQDGGWVPVWDGPRVKARSDGKCKVFEAAGAVGADNYVHNYCYGDGYPELDGFCTIQTWGGRYYVYEFWGCDLWDLRGFRGLWDTHNHGESSVWFYGAPDGDGVQHVIGDYWAHRSDPVNWTPVWTFKTCA